MALICWIAEFLLESYGAYRAQQSKYYPLAGFLGFRAFSEFVCAVTLSASGPTVYAWAWYGQALIQYVLFAVLVVGISAALLQADRHSVRFYSISFAAITVMAIMFFHTRSLTMANILHFSAATYFFLGMFVCVALFTRKSEKFAWYGIAALVLCCSNGLLSALQAAHWKVTGYYPIGEIVALGVWAWELRSRSGAAKRLSFTLEWR